MPQKASFLHFCQSDNLAGNVNIEVPLTFGTEILFKLVACMHCESIGSFKDQSYTIGYVPQLNWNWRAPNRAGFFQWLQIICEIGTFQK